MNLQNIKGKIMSSLLTETTKKRKHKKTFLMMERKPDLHGSYNVNEL